MSVSKLEDVLPANQAKTIARLLSGPVLHPEEIFSSTWQNPAMAQFASGLTALMATKSEIETVSLSEVNEVRCLLKDPRDRYQELLVSFEAGRPELITRVCLRPLLPAGVEVRPPVPEDVPELTRLELSAPVRREDGTEVVIDHNGRQFDHAKVVADHRWLAAFQDGRMVAVQGVAVAKTLLDGQPCRIAYNHYSRSDPQTRQGGNLLHLVMTMYRDVHPTIDQFLSIVDVKNTAGLRLSFGQPWPTRVRRLFLPVAALAARTSRPQMRAFDPAHAASLLNQTHVDMGLWVPRTPEFLVERQRRAPSVYTDAWRLTDHAALAVWPSGERRTYRKDGSEMTRRLALVLDYGFTGERGRDDLKDLLGEAARGVEDQGISHLALFVSDDHPPTQWLAELADGVDTYAICAPVLARPAPPTGPIYIDHILF